MAAQFLLQYSLRSLIIALTICGVVFAIGWPSGIAAVAGLLWISLVVAAGVAADTIAWGAENACRYSRPHHRPSQSEASTDADDTNQPRDEHSADDPDVRARLHDGEAGNWSEDVLRCRAVELLAEIDALRGKL